MNSFANRIRSRRHARRHSRAVARALHDAHSPALQREILEIVSRYR
jgi:hypothetical protein